MNNNEPNNSLEALNAIALTRVSGCPQTVVLELYRRLGSATAVIEKRNQLAELFPDIRLSNKAEIFTDLDEALHRAEDEYHYAHENGIRVLALNDSRYPLRLRECPDAPLVLYYKGNADLNQKRVISIVGTRLCTTYGQDLVRRFVNELRALCPHMLIISGLAYGIDICAHRHALENGYDTVAVLAHGLDNLYPQRHLETAKKMLMQGGLLTEYPSHTNADKGNFVRRNRIVAGLSDACILVESAAHGGGLITTRIARDYSRDVFAFPGAVGAPFSEGCNNLIRDNGAALITSAEDFVRAMGWEDDVKREKAQQLGIERQLFPELSPDEQRIVDVLQKHNDLQINMLAVQTNIAIGPLSALLFTLEMKGVVRPLSGGAYHLLK